MYPLDYAWSRVPAFPRELPMLDRPEQQRHRPLQGGEGHRAWVGAVCGHVCLMRALASYLPTAHRKCRDQHRMLDDIRSVAAIPSLVAGTTLGDMHAELTEELLLNIVEEPDVRSVRPSEGHEQAVMAFAGFRVGQGVPNTESGPPTEALMSVAVEQVDRVYKECFQPGMDPAKAKGKVAELANELMSSYYQQTKGNKSQDVEDIRGTMASLSKDMIERYKKETEEKEVEAPAEKKAEESGEEKDAAAKKEEPAATTAAAPAPPPPSSSTPAPNLTQVPLDPVRDGPVLEYRQAVARLLNKEGRDFHVSKGAVLRWRPEWGAVSHLGAFCEAEHEVKINVYVREILKPLQPKIVKDEKEAISEGLRSERGFAFVGVSHSFADLALDYQRGCKFVASPASLEDSRKLREYFKHFDMIMFVNLDKLDVPKGNYVGGFIYQCRSSNSFVGVLSTSFFLFGGMSSLHSRHFLRRFCAGAAGLEPSTDPVDERLLPRQILVSDFLVLCGIVAWRESKAEAPKSAFTLELAVRYKEKTFRYRHTELQDEPDGAMLEDTADVIAFTDPGDFKFTVRSSKEEVDLGTAWKSLCDKTRELGPVEEHVLELDAEEKANDSIHFLPRLWEGGEDSELEWAPFTLTVEDTSSNKEHHFIVPSKARLAKLLEEPGLEGEVLSVDVPYKMHPDDLEEKTGREVIERSSDVTAFDLAKKYALPFGTVLKVKCTSPTSDPESKSASKDSEAKAKSVPKEVPASESKVKTTDKETNKTKTSEKETKTTEKETTTKTAEKQASTNTTEKENKVMTAENETQVKETEKATADQAKKESPSKKKDEKPTADKGQTKEAGKKEKEKAVDGAADKGQIKDVSKGEKEKTPAAKPSSMTEKVSESPPPRQQQQQQEEHVQRRPYFDHSELNSDWIRKVKCELIWKGSLRLVDYDDRDKVVMERFAWVSVWPSMNSSEGMNVLTASEPPFPFHWRGILRGAVIRDREFLQALAKSGLMDRTCILDVTLAPDEKSQVSAFVRWHRLVQN